ncbi:MAG: hypothetical protein P9L97_06110 [Candidatus Tenebribacter davisii]|nr:hypothetical protein [Candidatus Tenebribacter davisii]
MKTIIIDLSLNRQLKIYKDSKNHNYNMAVILNKDLFIRPGTPVIIDVCPKSIIQFATNDNSDYVTLHYGKSSEKITHTTRLHIVDICITVRTHKPFEGQ